MHIEKFTVLAQGINLVSIVYIMKIVSTSNLIKLSGDHFVIKITTVMLQSQCFNYYFTLNRINLQAFSNINFLIKQKFTEFRNHNLTNQRVANLKFDFILSWSHITCRHLQHCISAIMRLPSKRIEKWQPKAIM